MEPLVLIVTAKPVGLGKGLLLGMIGGLDALALAKMVIIPRARPRRPIRRTQRFGILLAKDFVFLKIIFLDISCYSYF